MRARTFLFVFSLAAVGAGAARALTTSYLPVLLERIDDAPVMIGLVMTVNAIAGIAVPLAVGVWSDRRAGEGLGRRLPFMVGGTVMAAGGLVAIGLGHASSYIALALAAAVVYTGLNALTTAHRTLIAEDMDDERRPAATGAQELAMAVGGGVAVAVGAALIEPSPAAAFAIGAAVLALAALPTLLLTRRRRMGTAAHEPPPASARSSLGSVLRHRGAREVLIAQTLWVFAYAALPTFFVLYAADVLALGIGVAGTLPLAFGLFMAIGLGWGGRVRPERVHRMLQIGATLLGTGLLTASLASSVAVAALPLSAAALGAGLVTTLGFPYFARFVPEGEEGGYSGVFFAGRGVASAAALPLAGLAVELTGTYRAVLWLGVGAFAALLPLLRAEGTNRAPRPARVRAPRPAVPGVLHRWPARLAAATAAAIGIGYALPLLQPVDNELFVAVNGMGDGPEWLYDLLDPHARNYVLLVLLAVVGTAIVYRRARYAAGAAVAVVLAGYSAGAVLNFIKLFGDRARPEEVLGDQVLLTHGRTWAEIASYPSGHLIVTAALVTATAAILPRLRPVLYTYLAAIALTRITFGAHFPIDVVVGAVLGREFALFSVALATNARLLPELVTENARAGRAEPVPKAARA
jgi:MFS family permease